MNKDASKLDEMLMQQYKVEQMIKEIQDVSQQLAQLEEDAQHDPKAAEKLAKVNQVVTEEVDLDEFMGQCQQLESTLNRIPQAHASTECCSEGTETIKKNQTKRFLSFV